MIIRIENTYGNNTREIRTHLNHLAKLYGKVKKLGQRRFQALKVACNPTLEELQTLCEILVEASKK